MTQGNESSEFFRFQWELQWENDQKNKMAKNHFSIQIPPLKPPFRHFGNHFGPPKSDFRQVYIFGHFPIEIPIETEKIQNSHFPGSKCSTLIFL